MTVDSTQFPVGRSLKTPIDNQIHGCSGLLCKWYIVSMNFKSSVLLIIPNTGYCHINSSHTIVKEIITRKRFLHV